MTDDYASFGYLDHHPAAFARFPLAPESGRVPAYDGGFDPATIERAEARCSPRTSWSACTITRSGSRPTWPRPRPTTAPADSTPRSPAWPRPA